MTDAEKYTKKRKILIRQIENMVNTLALTTPEEARSKLTQLDEIWKKFTEAQEYIEEVFDPKDEDGLEAQLQIRFEFTAIFHKTKANFLKTSEAQNSNCNTSASSSGMSNSITSHRFKLPDIPLPKFNGKVEDFPLYWDLFNTAVHKNPRLESSEKLMYLKMSLEGEALSLVESMPAISASNYDAVREHLSHRWQNKKILVNTYLKNLMFEKSINGTAVELKRLLDCFRKNLNGLKQCGELIEHWNSWLVFLLTTKLNLKTREEWELKASSNEVDKYETLIEFLETRARALTVYDKLPVDDSKPKPKNIVMKAHVVTEKKTPIAPENKTSVVENTPNHFVVKCIFCCENHASFLCPTLKLKNHAEILNTVKEARACFNCLRIGHDSQNCIRSKCKHCGGPHHSILHLERKPKNALVSNPNESEKIIRANTSSVALSCASNLEPGLLATISLYAHRADGKKKLLRALFDPGAQGTLILRRSATKLQLPFETQHASITGVSEISASSEEITSFKISSRISDFSIDITAVVLESLTPPLPNTPLDHLLPKLPNLPLADPNFYKTLPIDIILGVKLFPKILEAGLVHATADSPALINTTFGWMVCGELPSTISQKNQLVSNLAVDDLLEKFWTIEEVNSSPIPISPENQLVEKHYVETTTRQEDGRFIVRLPFKAPPENLGNSRNIAIRMLKNIYNRLSENQRLEYDNFMKEYLDLEHMSRIPSDEIHRKPNYYLPHHAVFKNSQTSKIRVVFNASKKTDSGKSLNDILFAGPVVQDELLFLLIRYRFYIVAFCADAAKMYRQVLVAPEDRCFQRIVWFDDKENIVDYQLNTVTYGTRPGSFLATRTIQELAMREAENFPIASKIAQRDFYVDDLISGADSVEEASSVIAELNSLLQKGGFDLRKWTTNCPESLNALSENQHNKIPFFVLQNDESSALGIRWSTIDDMFYFHVDLPEEPANVCKRSILSESSRLFDPHGLISPTITLVKILLQSLWLSGADWDDLLPVDIIDRWLNIRTQLREYKFQIPRLVCFNNHNYSLHGFCDASQSAYAACIYVVSSENEQLHSRLLVSKTRVAPLKTISIPRLELSGALLLSQLLKKILAILINPPASITLWTDSTVVLTWIKKSPSLWKTFVANRVTEIQQLTTPDMWKHVPGHLNPADIASRGALPAQLQNPLWWNGPPFLCNLTDWPKYFHTDDIVSLDECRKQKLVCYPTISSSTFSTRIFSRYSNLRTLINVIGYCIRFYSNCRRKLKKEPRITTLFLHENEKNVASSTLVKLVQKEEFSSDIDKITKNQLQYP